MERETEKEVGKETEMEEGRGEEGRKDARLLLLRERERQIYNLP